RNNRVIAHQGPFRSRINNELLAEASSCFSLHDTSSPNDTTGLQPIAGAKYWGRADVVEWLNTCLSAKLSTTTRQWTNNLLYIMCNDGSACLTVKNSKTAGTSTCKAAMVFSGARKAGQQRAPSLTLSDFIESDLASGSIITGSPSFPLSDNDLSSDTAICLNGSINFTNELNNFSGVSPTINSQGLITPDLTARTLTLGSTTLTTSVIDSATGGTIDRSRLYGCSWYTGAQIFGTGFRTYFKFVIKNDLAGEGFTFALFDANRNPEINICGAGGEHLGYSGQNPDLAPILFPKMALEFDTTRQSLTRNDSNDRHAALVYWGYSHDPASGNAQDDDNVHGYPIQPQTGYLDPQARATRFINSLRAATAEERTFHVRMDVVRNYNSTAGYATYTINVWIYKIVMPGMNDTTKDYEADALDAPTLTDTLNIYDLQSGTEAFRSFRFGFTTGQSTRGQDIVLSNFELRKR
ncbi:MAG TPA: hypothetical protein PLW86_07740, partial [Rhodocyclaceae bacterium]|nr:hypothetical protein [Rhodocyclaceae bacterium]